MRTTTVSIILGFSLIAMPLLARADTLADLQAQLAALQSQLATLISQQGSDSQSSTVQGDTAVNSPAIRCVDLKYNLKLDDSDLTTEGDVTRLQYFLKFQGSAIYPEGRITGYYGPATMSAVQRWQSAHGIASSGDPDTTGYGYIGPKSRAALACPIPAVSSANLQQPSDANTPAILSLTATPGQLSSIHGTTTIAWTTQNLSSCALYYYIFNMMGVGYTGVKALVATSSASSGSYVANPI